MKGSETKRWTDDDYYDAVQPLRRASMVLKAPPLWKKIMMIPFFGAITLTSLPIMAVFFGYELLLQPKSQRHKVQVQASKTAFVVTLLRYTLTLSGLCADHLSHLFIPLPHRLIFQVISLFSWFNGKMLEFGPSRFASMHVRTEVGDELIRRFVLKHGGKQIVSLGSGFDTRAYRIECIKSQQYNVKYFEVDVQSTQQVKLNTLNRNKVNNQHVTYVPVDFSIETFTECLLRHGWKQDEPTLFLWEGVSMYLEEEAVSDTLKAVSKCARGSYLFFDALEDMFSEEGKKKLDQHPDMKILINYVASRGEPFKWGFKDTSKETVTNFINSFGFELIDYISTQDAENIFMKNADGVIAGRCSGVALFIIARVP